MKTLYDSTRRTLLASLALTPLACLAPFATIGCGTANSAAFDDGPSADASVTDTSGGGSDTTTPPADGVTPGDGSPTTDTSVPPTDGTPPPTDTKPPPSVTLDTVCGRLADTVCAAPLTACCSKRGEKFDVANCRDNVLTTCNDAVDQVATGERTFDPSQFDACAAAYTKLANTCSVPLLEYLRSYVPCQLLLNSTAPVGSSCTQDSDCHASPGAYANCGSNTGQCETISFVGKGASCAYAAPDKRICTDGLFCPFSGGGPTTCDVAKSLGSSCGGGPTAGNDPSCGFGNRCSGGRCLTGLPEDSPCSGDLQCASWSCNVGRCTDPNVEMATPQSCGG